MNEDETRVELKVEEKLVKMIDDSDRLELGTEEHSRAVKDITELMRVRNEQFKMEMDMNIKIDQTEIEKDKVEIEKDKVEIERSRLDIERKKNLNDSMFNWLSLGIGALQFVAKFNRVGKVFNAGMEFEQTGIWRSPWLKSFCSSNKMLEIKD